jgi:hypothetical protein
VAPLQVLITEVGKGKATVKVLWQGKPLENSEVVVAGESSDEAVKTDKTGTAEVKLPRDAEVVGVRASHIDSKGGEHDGKKYSSARSYATTVFRISK